MLGMWTLLRDAEEVEEEEEEEEEDGNRNGRSVDRMGRNGMVHGLQTEARASWLGHNFVSREESAKRMEFNCELICLIERN